MTYHKGFSGGSDNKESACNVGDLELILGYSSFQFSSVQSLSRVQLFVTVRTVDCQALSMGFSRQESDQIRSVAQLCLTLSDPVNRSTPGLPVHHQLPEFTQTYVHRVSDAIQPSHPLSSPSPPAPNPCQHHSHFQ